MAICCVRLSKVVFVSEVFVDICYLKGNREVMF